MGFDWKIEIMVYCIATNVISEDVRKTTQVSDVKAKIH